MGSLKKVCAMVLGITNVRKTIQENARIKNQGEGFNWGMPLRVVGGHQSLA